MKIILVVTVLISMFFAFLIVYTINDWYRSNFDLEKWEEIFYLQHFDQNKKKLYFLGSSFVVRINQTSIEESLLLHEKYYDVYNLGIPTDLPKKRIQSLDLILESKPDVIVYGIGFRDLDKDTSNEFNNRLESISIPVLSDNELDNKPKLENSFEIFFQDIFNIDFKNFKNPKFVSLKTLEFLLEGKNPTPPVKSLPKHPFQSQGSKPLLGTEQIKENFSKLRYVDRMSLNGTNAISLEEMISVFTTHDIKVFILLTPYHTFYLDQIPEEKSLEFFSKIKSLSEKYDVKIINLQDKYSSLKIWNDWRHIGFHVNSTVYYDDIAQMLIEGM